MTEQVPFSLLPARRAGYFCRNRCRTSFQDRRPDRSQPGETSAARRVTGRANHGTAPMGRKKHVRRTCVTHSGLGSARANYPGLVAALLSPGLASVTPSALKNTGRMLRTTRSAGCIPTRRVSKGPDLDAFSWRTATPSGAPTARSLADAAGWDADGGIEVARESSSSSKRKGCRPFDYEYEHRCAEHDY